MSASVKRQAQTQTQAPTRKAVRELKQLRNQERQRTAIITGRCCRCCRCN